MGCVTLLSLPVSIFGWYSMSVSAAWLSSFLVINLLLSCWKNCSKDEETRTYDSASRPNRSLSAALNDSISPCTCDGSNLSQLFVSAMSLKLSMRE